MDILEEKTDYEKLVAAYGPWLDLPYRPIVQEMMELDTQYYNLQEDLEN